jgi:soluble epoxide hydrolase / lipid-phosphate phosphatase
MSRGYLVIVPDMLGYGKTDSPESLEEFSLKSLSDDIAALTAHVCGHHAKIILGGHDWGGALVWRVALWHPDLLQGVFS